MTDQIKVLTVILDQSTQDNDVEALVNTIKSLKQVTRVETITKSYFDKPLTFQRDWKFPDVTRNSWNREW